MIKILDKKLRKEFIIFIKCYLEDSNKLSQKEYFDLPQLQRWIFKKVLDLGWTAEKFGVFDWEINRYSDTGRDANKPERIGKKYQWLAYYEALARISDNFKFRGKNFNNEREDYDGAWQLSIRNIDPSCLVKATARDDWYQQVNNSWWFEVQYNDWKKIKDNKKWVKNKTDLPYTDFKTVFNWAIKQDFYGRWMPEMHETYKVFLGEFFWSQAYKYNNNENVSNEWIEKKYDRQIPKPILVTSAEYVNESSSYDCSVEGNINIYLPCKWLYEKMELNSIGNDGECYNKHNQLVTFDPSVKTKGPGEQKKIGQAD